MNHRPATSSVLVAVCAAFCATGFGVEVAAAQDQAVSPNALEDEPLPKGLVLGGDGFPRLEPHLEEVLRRGGWPPNLGEIPALTDILLRRGEDPLVGDLQLLGAFALVTLPELQQGDAPSRSSSDRQERVPRNNIAAILPNGRAFPDRLPLLPPDEDAVVLVDGSLHTGSVQIATPNMTVGARTFQEGQVALVHLGVSPNPDDFQQAREAGQPDDTRSGEDPPPPERDPTGDTPPEGGRPGFGLGGPPDLSALDAGCWMGRILYTVIDKRAGWDFGGGIQVRYKVWLTERRSCPDCNYESSPDYVELDVFAIRYTVQSDRMTFVSPNNNWIEDPWQVQGMVWGDQMSDFDRHVGTITYWDLDQLEEGLRGFDPTIVTWISEQELQQLADDLRSSYGYLADSYWMSPPNPEYLPGFETPLHQLVSTNSRSESRSLVSGGPGPDAYVWIGNGLSLPSAELGAEWDLSGDLERRYLDEDRSLMAGHYHRPWRLVSAPHGEKTVFWHLTKHDKESCVIALPDLGPDDSKPCDHLRAKLARAEGWAEDDSAEFDWVADRLEAMAPEFARLTSSMEALRPYFDLALGLSAVSDASQELLKMALASHRLQAAAKAGQIGAGMAARITAIMKLMSLIGSPGGWTFSEAVDDQTKVVWGERFVDETVGNPADLIELYQRLQVIAAYTRGDDLDLLLDYVDNNLAMFVGSDYVVRKAKDYVQQAKEWNDLWADATKLTGRAVRLDYQISNAAMEAEHWRRELAECVEELEQGQQPESG